MAAIRHVTTGTYSKMIQELDAAGYAENLKPLQAKLQAMTAVYEAVVAKVADVKDTSYTDFMARRMVEMAGHIIMGYLLLEDATRNEVFTKSANNYVRIGEAEVARHAEFINKFNVEAVADYTYAE